MLAAVVTEIEKPSFRLGFVESVRVWADCDVARVLRRNAVSMHRSREINGDAELQRVLGY
jgi:hypothetical protein